MAAGGVEEAGGVDELEAGGAGFAGCEEEAAGALLTGGLLACGCGLEEEEGAEAFEEEEPDGACLEEVSSRGAVRPSSTARPLVLASAGAGCSEPASENSSELIGSEEGREESSSSTVEETSSDWLSSGR